MNDDRKTFDLMTYLFREEGFHGWVAQVLPLDVVTHGEDLRQALAMAEEAAGLIIAEDLNAGLNPFDRRAPPEDYERAFASVSKGSQPEPVALSFVLDNESTYRAVVVSVPATIVRRVDQHEAYSVSDPGSACRALQGQRCA